MQIGDPFPDFSLPRDGGGSMSLSDFSDRKLILFLYPKDDTKGCTRESIEFTTLSDEFEAAGAIVVGLSKDSPTSHDDFIDKFDLGMPLLSDEVGNFIESLGVWVEKNNYGHKYMGIERTTYLIDGNGILRQIWKNVKVAGHVDEVLEAVKTL